MSQYAISQLSVFIENKIGELVDVTGVLKSESIKIKSLLLVDSTDFGILRMITESPEKAKNALKAKGFTAKEARVFAVKVQDKLGVFNEVAQIFAKENIPIIYTYSFHDSDTPIFFFKVEDTSFEKAVDVLIENSVELIESSFFN